MTLALQQHAAGLLTLRCTTCGSGEIPVARDDHPHARGLQVTVPRLLACASTPHRWYSHVVAVFCSPACGLAWRDGVRAAA